MCDCMHSSQKVPTATISRRLKLAEVVAARQAASPRPSWCVLITKAWAIVATRRPELRRDFMTFPRPHLHEHSTSVASVVIERSWHEEAGVFLASIKKPETRSLTELSQRLQDFKEKPLESFGPIRETLRIARLPAFLRRGLQWFALNVSGYRRARHFGTFAVSTLSMEETESLRPTSLWSTLLHFGVPDKNGELNLFLTFDHRVMDGMAPAWALHDLEQTLKGEILAELQAMRVGNKPIAA